jgi:hypothetical protein
MTGRVDHVLVQAVDDGAGADEVLTPVAEEDLAVQSIWQVVERSGNDAGGQRRGAGAVSAALVVSTLLDFSVVGFGASADFAAAILAAVQ